MSLEELKEILGDVNKHPDIIEMGLNELKINYIFPNSDEKIVRMDIFNGEHHLFGVYYDVSVKKTELGIPYHHLPQEKILEICCDDLIRLITSHGIVRSTEIVKDFGRCSGTTTRIIDKSIQTLFRLGHVVVKNEHDSQQAHDYTFGRVMDRLHAEHHLLFENKLIEFDRSKHKITLLRTPKPTTR